MSIGSFFSDAWQYAVNHKRKLLGIAVGAVGVFFPPILPYTTVLGGVIVGSDFQVGAKVGTAIGDTAKHVVDSRKLTPADAAKLGILMRELP